MIGVTGTKGKTTTTHMIKTILETSGKKTGMIGTNGVYIGEEHFPTVNTTPESYDLHRYFAKMVEEGCGVLRDGGFLPGHENAPCGRNPF
ncbi:MAG: Mur ligase family protein [Clostridium sp.]